MVVLLLPSEFHDLVVYRASVDPKAFGGKGLVPMRFFKGFVIELTLVDIRLFCNPGKGIRLRWGIPLFAHHNPCGTKGYVTVLQPVPLTVHQRTMYTVLQLPDIPRPFLA